ncbi:EAL domain-containing protein [Campylobacter gastrosuis]|uniref:EAL domain-containing protein n=1 Tax=Campylobacter gastrosuis TaxID=2974576 RepID=A0ABT7HS17_9BACT|nr:EAL domain-containing protein [Campylobacter gastrosuis]MDL0089433.1 EAL domain-containing protein [Campylobacter gastrosuis]
MKVHKTRFLAFVLLIVFTACVVFIYKLSVAVNDNSGWRNAIMNLRLLNKEIDGYFKRSLSSSNYDDINQILMDFDTNLQNLKRVESFSVLAEIYGSENDLTTIQSIYDKKRNLVDRFNYINSGAVAFLIGAEYLMNEFKNAPQLEILMLRLKNSDFTDIHAINAIEYEVQNLSQDTQIISDAKNLEVLKRISYIVSSLTSLREINQQNVILNLSNYLDNILVAYDHQYSKIIDLLRVFAIVSGALFYVVCMFIFYQTGIYKKKLKEITMLQYVVDNDYSSVVFTDANNKITYVNKAFEKISEYSFEEVKGKNPKILKSYVHSENFYNDLTRTIYGGGEWTSDELVSRAKNGSYIYEKVQFLPFYYENELSGFVGIKSDKTREARMVREIEDKSDQIKVQSSIDKLTGFGNYFAITDKFKDEENGVIVDGMIVNITIKNFDNLRFFYKTKVIDAMLLAFANTLKLCVETFDIKAELFRFQDDDFYVWYNGDNIMRDIGYIQDYFSFNSLDVMVDKKVESLPGIKVVMGVSLLEDTAQTNRLVQSILANQQANKLGNEIYYYKENDAIEQRYYQNQIITQLIEYALENNTVIVECQGIYDVSKEGKATYYEVLVRLIDQNGKIRYPGEFLEVAMQAQLYTQITKKVIERAFLLVERYPDYTFSINLSGIDIIDGSVREFLEEKLQLCSNPSHVCFEILESEEITDYTTMISFIKHIKDYGAQISIDDFGSGYSNYYRILELDIDTIKIDGSIIKKLPFDQNARYLVETIMNFASKQGYKVVAEFVSSPEILEQVKSFNIKYAQGFLLGKPQAADEL